MDALSKLIKNSSAAVIRKRVTERVLQTVHVETEKRIFDQGKAAKNQRIGTYSKAYQKTRRRRGYQETRKVVLQAENDMRNDYKFLVLGDNSYGSGFTFDVNYNKSKWVEKTYKKPIFVLTDSEEKLISKLIDKEIEKLLNV